MLTKVLIGVFLLNLLHQINSKTISELKREILDQILPRNENDIMIAPGNLTSDFTNVEISMYILHIDDVNEKKGEISLRMYFRQFWQDHRLKYIANSQFSFVSINNEDAIWTPDTFVVTEKKSRSFDTIRPNVFIRIQPDGNVVYSKKISVTLNCPMDFARYPFDRQVCNLRFESYGYSADNLMLKWKNGAESVGMYTGFNTAPAVYLDKIVTLSGIVTLQKNYSYLGINFYFSRNLDTCVYGIYLPSFAMLVVSWLPFWINKKMLSSRLLISMGALLSYIMILCKFHEDQPQAEDSKTMLYFTGTNISFLILSVILTVLVHFFDKSRDNSIKLVENGDLNESNTKTKGLKELIRKFSGNVSHVDVGARFVIPFAYALLCVIYFASAGAFDAGTPIAVPEKTN